MLRSDLLLHELCAITAHRFAYRLRRRELWRRLDVLFAAASLNDKGAPLSYADKTRRRGPSRTAQEARPCAKRLPPMEMFCITTGKQVQRNNEQCPSVTTDERFQRSTGNGS
jgi:hypothetical protein